MININTVQYWSNRFETNWESSNGKEQTAYFADVMINNVIPRVLYETMSCLDWGCALGQLSAKWQECTGTKDVVGYDISEIACKKAKSFYSNIEFTSIIPKRKFDTVLCSNVLEHLDNWKDYLNRFTNMAEKYIVILVPENTEIFDEHVVSFTSEMFPDEVNGFACIQKKSIQCSEPKIWNDKQLLVTYMKSR